MAAGGERAGEGAALLASTSPQLLGESKKAVGHRCLFDYQVAEGGGRERLCLPPIVALAGGGGRIISFHT